MSDDVQVESGAYTEPAAVEEQASSRGKGENVRNSTFGHEMHVDHNGRDRWPSRLSFYMAAVGSAVGFGNGKELMECLTKILSIPLGSHILPSVNSQCGAFQLWLRIMEAEVRCREM